MFDHRILIERADGGVSVMQLSDEFLSAHGMLDEDGWRAAVHVEVDKAAVGSGWVMKSWNESDLANLPADRTFRDAWHHAGNGKAAVHMERARAIHLGRIRAARAEALAALDVDYQRADELREVEEKKRIARRKQALRDLPATVNLERHTTPERLANFWPAELPK